MKTLIAVSVAVLLLTACSGSDGAAGPAGPTGPTGLTGPPGSGGLTGVTTSATSGLTGGVITGTAALSLRTDCAYGDAMRRSGTGWNCSGAITRTVAYPAFEFRGPGVDLNNLANYWSQAATSGVTLTAPLHLPVGATLTAVRCMVASPDLSNAQLRVYEAGTGGMGLACASALLPSSGGPAAEAVATCTLLIAGGRYYYLQVNNTTSTGLTLEGACHVSYQGD
jgi:hypothetical protein